MTEARWGRLAASLEAAGVAVTVSTRSYPGGITRFMSIRRPDGSMVGIHDKAWRRNYDLWVGWEVHLADREGIAIQIWPITKKRAEVVAAVLAALNLTT